MPPAAPEEQQQSAPLTVQAFWLLAAKTAGYAASILIPLLLVRALDRFQFGIYKQVFLVVGTAQSVLPLGFAFSAFYFLPREKERRPAIVFHIALFNFCVGLTAMAVLLAFPQILVALFGVAELERHAALIGILILVNISGAFLETVATANQDVKYSALFIVAAQFSKTVFMLAAAILAPSVRAVILASILQGVLQCAVLAWYLASRFPGVWRGPDWPLLRTQWAYALPFGLSGLVFALQTDLPNYMVAKRFGPAGYAAYAIGCLQIPLLGLIYESMAGVMMPRLSFLQQRGDTREILLITVRAMRKWALFSLPVFFFLLVCGREFLVLLFTGRYEDSWPIFLVNLALIPAGLIPFDPILRAYAEHRYFPLRAEIVTTVALVVSLWIVLPRVGMLGAVVVVVACRVLERAVLAFRAATIVGFRMSDLPLLGDVARIAAAAACAALPAFALRVWLSGQRPLVLLAASGTAFLLTYAAALLVARVLTSDELNFLRARLGHNRHFC
ncbi:MAG: lipopolysaccharide biosynthesis protein [Acidobacteriota bacterium]